MLEIKITGLDPLAEAIALLASALAIGKDSRNPDLNKPVPAFEELTAPGLNMEVPVYTEEKEKPIETVKEEPKKTQPKKKAAPSLTKEEIRRAFMAKNTPENRPSLKQILEEFNAPNISNLSEEHYAAAMERLEALS